MKSDTQRISSTAITVVIVCLSILLARLLATFPLFEALHLKTVNSFFHERGPAQPADTSIVIVAIDEQTLSSLPVKWPYPGSYYARLVRNLTAAGARAIIFDIEFLETNAERPEEDFDFAEAIHESGRTLLAGKMVYDMNKHGVQHCYILKPNPWLAEVAYSWGMVNSVEDSDGFLRRYFLFQEYDGRFYYPLAIEALKFLEKPTIPEEANTSGSEFIIGKYRIPKVDANTMMINFAGPAGKTFRTYSFANVLDDSSFDLRDNEDTNVFESYLKWGTFRDKIVFVGATAEELWDTKLTPFFVYQGEKAKMPGVETHANALSTIRNEKFLRPVDAFVEFVLLVVLVILTALFTFSLKPLQALLAVVVIFTGLRFGAYSLFLHRGLIMNLTIPFLGVAFCYVGGLVYSTITEQKEKYRIRKIFQHYVSPSIVDKMLDSGQLPEFGGERRDLTVLFSDIRRFSHFSEQHEPEFVVSRLSDYFTEMVDIIFKHEGTLDKFVGDEIMAIFGAPLYYENHAERACHAALEMSERLRLMQQRWAAANQEVFEIGIGINTGKAVVGNLGSEQLFDYTVIGNEINLGARIESANKVYQTTILLSENTFLQVQDKAKAREIDHIRAVGLQNPVRIYELRSMETLPEIEQELIIDAFAEGLRLYRSRNWGEALKTFRRILRHFPNDEPSRVYTVRCLNFLEHPPAPDWDTIYDLKEK
jgi:adenylate cyclase